MGNSYLILVGIAPDSCSDLNGEYHQEESEELEDTGEAMRRGSRKSVSNTKGVEDRQPVGAQMNRQEEGDRESRESHGILGDNVGSVRSKLVCERC